MKTKPETKPTSDAKAQRRLATIEVAQVSKPAVSPISKSASRPIGHDPQVWKLVHPPQCRYGGRAIQQTWKSALLPLSTALLATALILCNPLPTDAAPGDVDPSFDPGSEMDGLVRASVVQSDGKIVVVGRFLVVPGGVRQGVARFNPDGTLDTTFADPAVASGSGSASGVYGLAVQPDGKILISGLFITSVGGGARTNIARLNADGSLDRTFQEGMDGTVGGVKGVAVQSDGKILIAGSFTSVNGIARKYVARLNPDGSLDTSFQDHPTWGEYAWSSRIAPQPDGKILIAGDLPPTRLNPDGSLDTSFTYGGSYQDDVGCLVLLSTGKILVGYGYGRNVTRLNANGSIDTSFSSPVREGVGAIALQPDGKIVVGGDFYVTGEATKRKVARLNANGSLDSSFPSPSFADAGYLYGGFATTVWTLARQTDGRILVGGYFGYINGQRRLFLARLNSDASLDNTFPAHRTGPDEYVDAAVPQADGKVLIAGTFDWVSGVPQPTLARLHPDGSLDNAFPVVIGDWGGGYSISASRLFVQEDGKIVIGGSFPSVNGVARSCLARLHPDGSLDRTFQEGISGLGPVILYSSIPWCYVMTQQPDRKILISGRFASVNDVARGNIARLNEDGSLDTTFQNGMSGLNSSGSAIAVQPDGKVLIGGGFTNVNGVTRNRIARLNANGSLDTSFLNGMAGANNSVSGIVPQPDGRILIRGSFTSVNGVARTNLARLNPNGSLDATFQVRFYKAGASVNFLHLQGDGRILVGGQGFQPVEAAPYVFARLNSDGSLDTAFTPVPLSAMSAINIQPFAIQPDGTVLIGGLYSSLNGYARHSLARMVLYDDLSIRDCRRTNGLFSFNLAGPPGQTALIQASTNLTHWTPIATNTLGSDPIPFTDPQSDQFPQRFYRLLQP